MPSKSNTALPMALPPSAKAPPRQTAEMANPDTAMTASLVRISLSLTLDGFGFGGIQQAEMQPGVMDKAANDDVEQKPSQRHQADAGGDEAKPRQPKRGGAAQYAGDGAQHHHAGEQGHQPNRAAREKQSDRRG